MSRRTEYEPEKLNNFTGVRQVGLTFKERIGEIHGMYDFPVRSLQRLPGKILQTTGLADGKVWSLHQLKFRDRTLWMSHEGPNLYVTPKPLPRLGRWFPIPQFFSPEEYLFTEVVYPPFQFDWPEFSEPGMLPAPYPVTYQIPFWVLMEEMVETFQQEEITHFTGVVTSSAFLYRVIVDPAVYILTQADPEDSGDFYTNIIGFSHVQISWDDDWISVVVDGVQYESGDVVSAGTIAYPDVVTFSADINEAPVGNSDTLVTFQLVDSISFPTPLADANGNLVQQLVTVTTQKPATFTLSTYPSWIVRGENFELEIQASDNTYVPSVQVNLTDDDPNDNISPLFTNNTGWVSGRKTVTPCQFTGGAGDNPLTLTADDGEGTNGSLGITVRDPSTRPPTFNIAWTQGPGIPLPGLPNPIPMTEFLGDPWEYRYVVDPSYPAFFHVLFWTGVGWDFITTFQSPPYPPPGPPPPAYINTWRKVIAGPPSYTKALGSYALVAGTNFASITVGYA